MPVRKPPASTSKAPSPARGDFRQRYDAIEAHREKLILRLRALGANARSHPAYRRALVLLNETFRKSKLAQRLAVLQAAAWLIDILERLGIGI